MHSILPRSIHSLMPQPRFGVNTSTPAAPPRQWNGKKRRRTWREGEPCHRVPCASGASGFAINRCASLAVEGKALLRTACGRCGSFENNLPDPSIVNSIIFFRPFPSAYHPRITARSAHTLTNVNEIKRRRIFVSDQSHSQSVHLHSPRSTSTSVQYRARS